MDFLGFEIPLRDGTTKWSDGPALLAWRRGLPFIVNEIDRAADSALTALYAICDDPDIAGTTLSNGEFVRPKPGFRVIATSNASVAALPGALQDRFTVRIIVDRPCEDALKRIANPIYRELVETTYTTYADAGSVDAHLLLTYREGLVHYENLDRGVPENVSGECIFGKRWGDIKTAIRRIAPSYEFEG